jgi:hypothetical protein
VQVRGDGVLNSTDRRRGGKGSEQDVRREKKQRRESFGVQAENAALAPNAQQTGKGGKGAQVKKWDEDEEAGERGEVDQKRDRRDERRQKKKEHCARALSDD